MAGGQQDGAAEPARSLPRLRDPGGRLRGFGFPADARGTVVTGYEVVAQAGPVAGGLLLETAEGGCREIGPAELTVFPELGLALLAGDPATVGEPLPIMPAEHGQPVPPGQAVLVLRPDGGPALPGALLGTATALAVWPGSSRLLDGVLLLELPPGTPAEAGLPVLEATSGAVLGLLAPALRGLPPGLTGALPLGGPLADGQPVLAELLARNALAVPAYGRALNLGGVLHLASRQLAAAVAGPGRIADLAADRVDRADGLAGEEPQAALTVLVGEPGSGRTTELAALAVRRAGGARPLPTLWLRGADLWATDRSPAAAVGRALDRLAGGTGPADGCTAKALARVCAAAGRPLLVVLDGPEEAPAALGPAWWRETRRWLRADGARLLLACRPESWDQCPEKDPENADGEDEEENGEGADGPGPGEPVRLHRLGPLRGAALERAARRYGAPAPEGESYPLALRLAGELRTAGVEWPAANRAELFGAWIDLHCLRIAQRIADDPAAGTGRPPSHRRGSAVRTPAPASPARVRRLAALVAGRLHEAARRMLGPGQGGLGPAAFEELFPSGGGWARAVLAEGLFVPAGDGYRLAHEEVADWLQGLHLDLDAALRLLLAEEAVEPMEARPARRRPARAVPRHRVGAVEAALRTLGETRGAHALDLWLHRIWRSLDTADAAGGDGDPQWWAARLLTAGLRASPRPVAHRELLTRLADRIAQRSAQVGGFAALRDGPAGRPSEGGSEGEADGEGDSARGSGLGLFGPGFWDGLALPPAEQWDLLRSLVRADGPEQGFLALASARLRAGDAADAASVLPLICRWFEDGRGLPARPGATVADLGQDLLYAHRALAVDELTEVLVSAAHSRADALLTVLAVEEPSALCRAVDRWSHDPRPERHVAAAVHALRAAPYAGGAGAELLRYTALTLLAREEEPGLHGAALALLVRDPLTRARHLPAALEAYAADDPFVTAEVLGTALGTEQATVLAAFEARLALPGTGAAAVLRVLADAVPGAGRGAAPGGLSDPATRLAGRLLRERPERAELVAEYLNRRLVLGTAARGDLTALLGAPPADRPAAVRLAFALVLATPAAGPVGGEALRQEFLDRLLATERDPAVLAPVLERVALIGPAQDPERARAVVRRIADAWERGAAGPGPLDALDALLVRCAGRTAGFAQLLAEWPPDARPPAGGPLLTRMRALVEQGRDPQYAAAEAERAPTGTLAVPSPRAAGLPVPGRGRAHGTL